ncbi:hypothetical protein FAY30_26900 (plasmid) [Bacillus sp. S3]|uniref:hypothetical protein n=1 Tax=Bacillus sp. S3 TaxID=486398 RepID=UPI0011897808|nr:hypothetical protein [Bacillus sp. S3]QCJ45564.1 hypothetical protein FAY30_26900 [Bacillus sp. S3]
MQKLRERLKPLSTKKKIEYLIEYYSFHFIAVIVVIFFLFMGFNTFANQPKEMLEVRMVGENFHDGLALEVQRELEPFTINRKRSQKEQFSVLAINTSEASGDPASLGKIQKLGAEIAAKEVDVLLLDEKTFHQFNEEGNLYDLSTISGTEDWKETKYSSSHAAVTGIDISKVSYFSSLSGNNEPLIFAVLANTERIDEVENFIDYLN